MGGMERSNNGDFLLKGTQILKRSISEIKTSDEHEGFHFGARLPGFIYLGYLTCNKTAENNDMSITEHIDVIHNRFKLVFSKKRISVIDIESQQIIEEFGCDIYEESIVDATFSKEGNHIVYITETSYSGNLKYRKEFKPIQTLIDETVARFSQSELTENERKQCYLD